MKILIASDNHRDQTSLEELIHIYDDIDVWLHCGDSEFSGDHPIWDTFKTVKGNMDWESLLPDVHVGKAKKKQYVVLHGHRHQVKHSLEPMAEVAKENDASLVFYGHTHVAKVDEMDGIYFINPGSIKQPRGSLRVGSYAIYEEIGEEETIQFFDWNHNELPELSQKLN